MSWFSETYLRWIKRLILPRDIVRFSVKRNADKIAVVDGKRELTYKELYERANRLANALLDMGLGKGDKLALLIYNCQEYFEVRIASCLTDIVLVPITWDTALEDIIFILNDCEVKVLVYHPEIMGGNIERVKKETRVKEFIEIASPSARASVDKSPRNFGARNDGTYEDWISRGVSHEPKIKIKEDDLASINFSSGTTGRPKGVSLTQKSWVSSFYNYVLNSTGSTNSDYSFLHALSFATAGSTAFLLAVFLGAKNIIMKNFDVKQFIELILQYKINIIGISPSLFIPVLEYCRNNNVELPVSRILIGSEALPQEKFKEGIQFFGPIVQQGYGMVEVLPPLCLLYAKDYIQGGKLNEERLLSVGRPLEGVKLKIVDKKGKRLPARKIGKVAIKSHSISAGYWNNPGLTQRHYKGSWFYTDDFGYIDMGGYLYLLGREEDILKDCGGEIVFTRSIEEALHRHPRVLEACAFKDEEKIIACISLKDKSKNVFPEEIIEFCGDKLEESIIPNVVNIYAELPKNASGKLDRQKIRKELFCGYPPDRSAI